MSRLRSVALSLGCGAVGTLTGVGASLPYDGWAAAIVTFVVGSVMAVLLGCAIGIAVARKDGDR